MMRARDYLGAGAASAWFGLSIFESAKALLALPDNRTNVLVGAFYAANIIVLALMIIFLALRRAPVRLPTGGWPRLSGFLGLISPLAIAFVPISRPGPAAAVISATLMLAGAVLSIWTMLHLRRAFAILPQARVLVATGPYSYVRHPLYLSELITVAGVTINHVQPIASFVFLIVLLAQLPRLLWEERILGEAFPAYRDYAQQTARFIPFIY